MKKRVYGSNPTLAKAVKPKAKKRTPKKDEFSNLTVEQMRKKLGDSANKEIFVRLGTSNIRRYDNAEQYPKYLNDLPIHKLQNRLYEIAEKQGATDDDELKLQCRKIPVTKMRKKYTHGSFYGKTVMRMTTELEGPYWVITFTRPMTDEEIEKDGPQLLRNKKKADERKAAKEKKEREKAEAERQADIQRIKALAAKHGVKVDV